jgi:hypothetical protein
VFVTAVTKDNINVASRVAELLTIRAQQGAQPSDPLLAAWDLDSLSLHRSKPLQNGQALAIRLQRHLTALVQRFPGLVQVNPRSYGMHSLRRGGVIAAWKAGVDVERLKVHGRWASAAVQAYMTPDTELKLSVSLNM